MDLSNYQFKKSKKLSPRKEMIEKIIYELGIDEDRKRGIYFLCNEKITDKELYDIWQQARSWKVNPPALFYKLLKAKRKEMQKQLDMV